MLIVNKGGPCRELQEGIMTNQIRCLVLHVALNFWGIFLLKNTPRPPGHSLSLQTPAPDRDRSVNQLLAYL